MAVIVTIDSPSSAQTEGLVKAPRVKGSTEFGGTQLTFRDLLSPLAKPTPEFPTPAGGGTARLNIADNNKALPLDRIFFTYNHFKNALQIIPGAESGLPPRQFSISRYTVGFEKTLFCECRSLEVRVPVVGTYQDTIPGFSVAGENAGNISLIFKQLISKTDSASSVIGLGLSLPTGTDINGRVEDVSYKLQNESVHLSPYTGFLLVPNERVFYHGFLQFDVVANGNPVYATPASANSPTTLGMLNEQNLMHIDLSAGQWLYQMPRQGNVRGTITGVAVLGELHYTTTLQNTDFVGGVVDDTVLEFANTVNRVDILNATVGLHVEFDEATALRFGGAFPLKMDPDRAFDAEILFQLNHRF